MIGQPPVVAVHRCGIHRVVTASFGNRDSVGRARTSSFCSTGACVGVEIDADVVHVVDTKNPVASSRLSFTRDEWAAFVAGVKAGEFDLG